MDNDFMRYITKNMNIQQFQTVNSPKTANNLTINYMRFNFKMKNYYYLFKLIIILMK